MDALDLGVDEAAQMLGIPLETLACILDGDSSITPDIALRLEQAGWSNSAFWLRRQAAYDSSRACPRTESRS